jgi:hypothetical protein
VRELAEIKPDEITVCWEDPDDAYGDVRAHDGIPSFLVLHGNETQVLCLVC